MLPPVSLSCEYCLFQESTVTFRIHIAIERLCCVPYKSSSFSKERHVVEIVGYPKFCGFYLFEGGQFVRLDVFW